MKVAIGRISITPADVSKIAMAGYTRPHFANGKLDDVYAHGILMEDIVEGNIKKRFLMLSLDVLKIPLVFGQYIKDEIKKNADFALGHGQIFIHGTHTHSAPDLTGEFYWPGNVISTIKGIMFGKNRNDEYCVFVARQIVKLVKELLKKLEPAEIAWKRSIIDKDIIINRRHPIWRSKGDLNVMVFRRPSDKSMIGILVNFQCHPTSLAWSNDKISADYPGRVVARIEELTQGTTTAVFFNGPAGDLNPITTCKTDFERYERDQTAREKEVYSQKGTYEHCTKLGYTIGEEALSLAKSIKDEDYYDAFTFNAYLRTIWIPLKDFVYLSNTFLNNKVVYLVKKYLMLPIAMIHDEEPNFPGLAIKKKGLKITGYSVLSLADFRFIKSKTKESKRFIFFGTPGELFEKIGDNLEKVSPAGKENTFIIQNVNDWIAYLFPKEEYITQGGYEPLASFGPTCGYTVEKEMYQLLREILVDTTMFTY